MKQLGDYKIIKELGRGAMGVVYEAIQEKLNRRVALKVLPSIFATNKSTVERFKREAEAAVNGMSEGEILKGAMREGYAKHVEGKTVSEKAPLE